STPDCKSCKAHEEASSTDDSCAPPCKKGARIRAFGDVLYWNVHNSGVPFAQPFDGVDPLTSVPRGPVGVAALSYRTGYRAGAGVALGDSGWLVGTYTHFQDGTSAHSEAGDGNVLHSNLVFPNTINAGFAPLSADANYNIRLNEGDIDYEHTIVD